MTTEILFTVITTTTETVHAHMGSLSNDQRNDLIAKAHKAILAGHTVRWPDGSEQWRDSIERFPYEWHSDGNRVLNDVVRIIKTKDGEIERTVIRQQWRLVA